MLWFCGFNGFQQLNNLIENIQSYEKNDKYIPEFVYSFEKPCTDLLLNWSNILLIKGNTIILYGFIKGKVGQTFLLETPDKQTIVQGSCNNTKCLFVTKEGKCWQYSLENFEWKELIYLSSNYVPDTEQNNKLIKVALGEIINAALTDHGEVWNLGGQLSTPEIKVVDIDCGKEHGILLTDTGQVYTWGGGSRGQLGTGILDSSEEPCEVQLLVGLIVVTIAAGGWHNAVLTKDGDIYTWGWNKQGQLGHPTIESNSNNGVAVLSEPRLVDWPDSLGVLVKEVKCGTSHTVALFGNGEVWGCGWNKWGQLGTNKFQSTTRMTRLEMTTKNPIQKVICGSWNTVLVGEET